jgi:hypothetical protein
MSRILTLLAGIAIAAGLTTLPALAGKPQFNDKFAPAAAVTPPVATAGKKKPKAGVAAKKRSKRDKARHAKRSLPKNPGSKRLPPGSVQVGPQPEPPGRHPDPFTPGGDPRFIPGRKAGAAAKLPAGTSRVPTAKAVTGAAERERFSRMLRSTISGRIKLRNCVGGASNVRIRLFDGRRTREVTALPITDNPGAGIRYSIGGLTAGRYTLTPRLTGVRCPGGNWSDVEPVTIGSRIVNVRRDFGYVVELKKTVIPERVLIDTIQNVFSGTQIRLHNYRGNDSYVRLPSSLGSREIRFVIPVARDGAFRYYVRDINLDSIRAGRKGAAIKLSFQFESNGTELEGRCRGPVWDCPLGRDDTAPDAHLNNLRVDVYLTPARFVSGRGPVGLSFGDIRVNASVSADVNGIIGSIPGINEFIEREIRGQLRTQLRSMIDQRSVRAQVAAGLRSTLDALGVGTIQEVRFVGSSLVIRHLPV